jgi:putative spermidine/putrescine transport system ATP-binding protein
MAAPDDTAYVELRSVQKTYDGRTRVVHDLDLSVAKGEFLTLLGPSGSGKTTILMMLAGFEIPTSGDILLDGRSIARLPPHKRDIGVVFQDYALFPHLTVNENVAFPLAVRGRARAEIASRVERALAMVRLGPLGDRRPAQLSGGQRQRVALARALVFEPRLVLMDEPLGALDKQLREHMQIEISHLHKEIGVTIVYVTHDQSEALTMSDRIAVFDQGVIQQVATPSELYEAPRNAFVAGFIGENNLLAGAPRSRRGDTCVVALEGGGEVEALAASAGEVGEAASLSLRPERVRLDPPEGELPNVFDAVVRELIYQGDHTRVRLRLGARADSTGARPVSRPPGARDDFVVKVASSADPKRLAVGQQVRVGWRVADCRALDPGILGARATESGGGPRDPEINE